jgi:hypothetical protein
MGRRRRKSCCLALISGMPRTMGKRQTRSRTAIRRLGPLASLLLLLLPPPPPFPLLLPNPNHQEDKYPWPSQRGPVLPAGPSVPKYGTSLKTGTLRTRHRQSSTDGDRRLCRSGASQPRYCSRGERWVEQAMFLDLLLPEAMRVRPQISYRPLHQHLGGPSDDGGNQRASPDSLRARRLRGVKHREAVYKTQSAAYGLDGGGGVIIERARARKLPDQ